LTYIKIYFLNLEKTIISNNKINFYAVGWVAGRASGHTVVVVKSIKKRKVKTRHYIKRQEKNSYSMNAVIQT